MTTRPNPDENGGGQRPERPLDDQIERLRDELRAATRAREVLLASVAHDLRNPLNTFSMSAGLLREDVEHDAVDPSRALSLIARMDRAAHRMQALIEDLLEASRIEAGKVELELREEPAVSLVRGAVAATKAIAAERGASVLIAEVDDAAAVTVDYTRAVQAVAKAITFALRVTGEGGAVELSVREEPGGAPKGGRTAVVLTALAAAGRECPAYDEGRGSLALMMARGLVELHGGELRIDNAPTGSKLTLAFPAPRRG